MRKYGIFLTLVFLLFWATEGKAQLQWQVLSPMEFTRGTGSPVTETFNFSAAGGTAIFKLSNGSLEDASVEKVSSSVLTVNGQIVADSSNFDQNVDYIEKEISLLDGQNTLEVVLKGKPGGQVIIQIVQDVAEVTSEMAIMQTANALRAGDIQSAAESFARSSKDDLLMSLDREEQNLLADWLQNSVLISEKKDYRVYKTGWVDEQGIEHNFEIMMVRDKSGKWEIISW